MGMSFRILVIEDNLATQEALKKSLSRLGCQVDAVESSEKGMEEIKKTNYDAIFAALCVREKGARGIARFVKSQSARTKFFVVTSWKGELEQNLLHLDGIHDIIHKPLIFKDIRDKLLEHLG
jgi:two-component system, sensor histidine kinase and response regulator